MMNLRDNLPYERTGFSELEYYCLNDNCHFDSQMQPGQCPDCKKRLYAENIVGTPKAERHKALQDTADYLYNVKDEGPLELLEAISWLRQLINEEYVHKDKMVSSQLIYDVLYPTIEKLLDKAEKKAWADGHYAGSNNSKQGTQND